MKQIEKSAAKLVALQNKLLAQYDAMREKIVDAAAFASEPEPVAFDESAAVRRVAVALAEDAINGTNTAEAIKAAVVEERASVSAAITKYRTKRAETQEGARRMRADCEALKSQICEVDKMIRDEVARESANMQEDISGNGEPEALAKKLADLLALHDALSGLAGINNHGRDKRFALPSIFSQPIEILAGNYRGKEGGEMRGGALRITADKMATAAGRFRDQIIDEITGGGWQYDRVHYIGEEV